MSEQLTRTDKEWHERRRKVIGASDAGALMNCDPYRNRGNLWLEKTGRLEPSKDTKHTRRGTALESAILHLFEMEQGVEVERGLYVRRGLFAAELDGAVVNRSCIALGIPGYSKDLDAYLDIPVGALDMIVEAKSAATVISRQTEEPDAEIVIDPGWGRGTDEVPFRVICQATVQMYAGNCQVHRVPVFSLGFRSFDFEIKHVRWDAELMEMIEEAGDKFWGYVQSDTPPPNAVPTLDALKRRIREPKSFRRLDESALAVYERFSTVNKERIALEKQEAELQAAAIALLGDDEEGILPDGRNLRYMLQKGQWTTDRDLLLATLRRLGEPRMYDEIMHQGEHRTFRCVNAKVGAKKR